MPLPDTFFHLNPDGTRGRLKTLEERKQEENRQQLAEMSVRAQVAAETEKPSPSWQETYLDYARERLKHAHNPTVRKQARERVRMAEQALGQHEEQQAAEAKQARFNNHAAVKNARQHAEAFSKSPPPGADLRQVALAVAFAQTNAHETPEQLVEAYWTRVLSIEEQALQDQQRAADVAQAAAYKANAEAAQAKTAELETQQRLNHAKDQLKS